jgi:hypothetical protein
MVQYTICILKEEEYVNIQFHNSKNILFSQYKNALYKRFYCFQIKLRFYQTKGGNRLSFFAYSDPILGKKRKGDSSDPFIPITQSVQINQNGVAQLAEVPNKLSRIQISGLVEVDEVPDTGLEPTMFHVDYVNGLIEFHPSLIGQTVSVSFVGEGATYFPVSRIWTKTNDGLTPAETLDAYIDSIDNFNYKGIYSATTQYTKFNLVTYQGVMYIATSNPPIGTVPTNTAYWSKLGSVSFKGTYSNSANYMTGDIVNDSLNQTLYACLADNTINIPLTNTTYWKVMIDISSIVNAFTAAENTRVSNENIRISNENTRIAQENQRQTDTYNAIAQANTARDNANAQANYAKSKGDYANAAGDYANNTTNSLVSAVTSTKLIWKPYVSTYSAIATTYPTPDVGWTTKAQDTGVRYRYDGASWVAIDALGLDSNPTPYLINVTIVHNLNTYPEVLVLKAPNSYGNGGFGATPYGGSNVMKLINTVEYFDRNSLRVFVTESFSGTPTLTQNSATDYTVVFSSDISTLEIILK